MNTAFCSLRVSIPAYVTFHFYLFFSLLRIVIFTFVFHLHSHPFAFRFIIGARYESRSNREFSKERNACVSSLRMEMKGTRTLVNFISLIETCGLSDVR